jgi:hypothetical protein
MIDPPIDVALRSLLNAIDAGMVATDPDGTIRRAYTPDWSQWTRVTPEVHSLAAVGWAERGPDGVWTLTDISIAVLGRIQKGQEQ